MVDKRTLQAAALYSSAFVLLSLLLGKYLMAPAIRYISNNWLYFLLGAGVVSICGHIYQMGNSIHMNLLMHKMVKMEIPETTAEMRRIGVNSPLDFTYVMWKYTQVYPVPLFGGEPKYSIELNDKDIWENALSNFETMFGRLPEASESKNWETIARFETARITKQDPREITFKQYESKVSDRVRRYFSSGRYFEKIKKNSKNEE